MDKTGTGDYCVEINGIKVHASYSDSSVNDIFLPFLRSMTDLQRTLGRRILVMLAAPPGAGKSTLLSYLQFLSSQYDDIGQIQTIGIDGFHRYQKELETHTIIRDGVEIPLVRIKGAPITFDLERLTERIQRVAGGDICGWPGYDRMLHNPVENVTTVDCDIVLLEGNYLLLKEKGWRDLRQYADYTVSITADEDMLRKRLIERRMQTGVPEEESRRFVDFSDMENVRICLEESMPADLMLKTETTNGKTVYREV